MSAALIIKTSGCSYWHRCHVDFGKGKQGESKAPRGEMTQCRDGQGQPIHFLVFIIIMIPGILEAPDLKEATEEV